MPRNLGTASTFSMIPQDNNNYVHIGNQQTKLHRVRRTVSDRGLIEQTMESQYEHQISARIKYKFAQGKDFSE